MTRFRRDSVMLVALACCLLALAPAMAFAASPHGDFSASLATGTSKCAQCHRPHVAPTTQGLLSIEPTTGALSQTALCYKCHGYAGPARNAAASFEFALPGGHRTEDATGAVPADLTNTCSGCHDAHTNAKGLPRSRINGRDVSRTVDANSWCLACHDPDLPKNWSGLSGAAYYDTLFAPASVDTSGYPMLGTFRGAAAYQASAHASIPASATAGRAAGDCLWCHASHRSPNARDGLLDSFGPTAPGDAGAGLCLRCHDQASSGYGTGHTIKSSGGMLAPGSPLPCYECHNVHGSRSGNTALVSDALGGGLNPSSASTTFTVETLSRFCFTCHTSAEGYWWDSVSGVMAPPENIANAPRQSVAGISRLGGALRLPAGPAAHTKDGMSGCSCHGASVHNPSQTPISAGGQSCYMCHSVYEGSMEKGSPSASLSYHHVMGTGAGDGDTAFPNGSYPTSASDLYCMSCHNDHDMFNGSKAANLRANLGSAATTAATDYLPTGTYGICVSCHSVSRAKDADQASDGMADTDTPKIVGGTGAGRYGSSAHNYAVASPFDDATSFGANCSKCHNDEQPKEYQLGVLGRFGTHFSAVRRLLAAYGGTPTDPLGERHCFGCHSRAGDVTGGKTPAQAGRDYYGVAVMSAASENVYAEFALTGSTHPVGVSPTGSLECESCHNAHVVSAVSPVTDPSNTYNAAAYTTTTQKALFCLTCHDSDGGPARTVSDSTYVPYTVTMTKPRMNKSLYALRGHWSANGSISAAETKSCDVCHDSHGSDYTKLLGVRDVATGTNRINGQVITGNDTSVCYACHTVASTSYPVFTREGGTTGYPTNGTWPGRAVHVGATTGVHETIGPNADGDCKICHDVHGTANAYDGLTSASTATDYTLCFSCHDGNTAGAVNIKQSYPVSVGGTQPVANNRYGHKGTDGGTPADRPLACYNCHNPHGSPNAYGLQVITEVSAGVPISVTSFGTSSGGRFNRSDAAQVRRFCFTCHVPSDVNQGWNGTAFVSVAAGARVDGFDRITQTKLDNRGAHRVGTNQNCYQCHVGGPHNPRR